MIDIDGFRQYLYEEEMAQNTILSYLRSLQVYAEQYDDIDKGKLIEWKQEQLQRFKPTTVNLRIAGLMRYCRFKKIPMTLKSVQLPNKTTAENIITQEQLDTLLSGLAEDQNRCWRVNVLLLAKTGMRISEALRIKKSDVEHGSVILHTKGHMREIFFPDSLVDEIWEDIDDLTLSDQVVRGRWCNSSKLYPIHSAAGFRNSLKLYGTRYGLPKEVLHPHSFRHYFAMEFLKECPDIALLADILGHRSIDTTRIYLKRSREQLKSAVNEAIK